MDRVRERTKEIHDRADGDLFPDGRGVAHAGMPFAGVEESVVGPLVYRRESPVVRSRDDRGSGAGVLEQIRRAGEGGGAVVAVFRNQEQAGGDDGGRRRDVEGVVAVAAGAYDVALHPGRNLSTSIQVQKFCEE